MKDFIGKSVAANYGCEWGYAGGKLHFEKTGIIFRPHAFNFRAEPAFIQYHWIAAVAPRNTL